MHWRVLRWEVPVDDRPHRIGAGMVLAVEQRPARVHGLVRSVEVWTLEALPDHWPESGDPKVRWAQVFGTGQPLPPSPINSPDDSPHSWVDAPPWIGSTIDQDPGLVWHVFEVQGADRG